MSMAFFVLNELLKVSFHHSSTNCDCFVYCTNFSTEPILVFCIYCNLMLILQKLGLAMVEFSFLRVALFCLCVASLLRFSLIGKKKKIKMTVKWYYLVFVWMQELQIKPCPVVFAAFSAGSKACMSKVFQVRPAVVCLDLVLLNLKCILMCSVFML